PNKTCSAGCNTDGSFVDGALTAHDVALTLAGSGATFTAPRHAGGAQHGTSNTFTVDPAAADHLTFTSDNSSVESNHQKTLTAEIRDAFQNVVDSNAVVAFTQTAGAGTVDGLGPVAAIHGVATRMVTGDVAGSVTIRAASGSLTPDTSTFSVTPDGAHHIALSFKAATNSTTTLASGATGTLTAKLEDL